MAAGDPTQFGGETATPAGLPVICLTSHNRLDCARINQEIIKLNYSVPLPIVHATAAADYRPYLEDVVVPCKALPMTEGAIHLLQQSVQAAVARFDADYLVHLEADTWLLDETVIHRLIADMVAAGAVLCASGWGVSSTTWLGWSRVKTLRRLGRWAWQAADALASPRGGRLDGGPTARPREFGTQFFIMHRDVVPVILAMKPRPGAMVENVFFEAFQSRFGLDRVLTLHQREPVHPDNRHTCEALSLYAQHWPARGTSDDQRSPGHLLYVGPDADGKRESLLKFPAVRNGAHLQKLLTSADLGYYNRGALRH